ncbi:MAG: hypothetical protein ABUT20_40205 [Bacteroidota bacterium]
MTTEQAAGPSDPLWLKFLPGILSSLIGFVGAYILFWNGFKKQKEKEKQKETDELIDYFQYLVFSVKRILGPSNSQRESFIKLVEQLKIEKASDYHFSEISSFNFKWFDEIDKSKAQKAFFENFEGSEEDKYYYYNQLLKSIDLLSLIARSYKPNFEHFLSKSISYNGSFKEWILTPIRMIDIIVGKDLENLNPLESEMLTNSIEWYKIKDEAERFDIYTTYSKWIVPMGKMQHLHLDPDLLKALRHLTSSYGNFKKNQDHIRFTFENYIKALNGETKRIRVILRKVERQG